MNILLIEDDPGIGRFVSRGLTAEGFTVEWLRAGREAGDRLRTDAFVALILDLGLPDIDGTDLCRELRRDGVDTPILMLTARDGLEDKLEGFRRGADDYLCKPFAFEELIARVRALAQRRERSDRLSLNGLTFDLRARAVEWGGMPISLSPREYDVLACLARASPSPLRRQEILDAVWGAEAEINENTVDVYVGYLRRRLAGLPGGPRIESVRGVGFRLATDPAEARDP
jgi:DNA-binding response OmpR family regulator